MYTIFLFFFGRGEEEQEVENKKINNDDDDDDDDDDDSAMSQLGQSHDDEKPRKVPAGPTKKWRNKTLFPTSLIALYVTERMH